MDSNSAEKWIGAKGRWSEDNDLCEIIAVEDAGAGAFLFRSLTDCKAHDWLGFLDDFFWDGE